MRILGLPQTSMRESPILTLSPPKTNTKLTITNQTIHFLQRKFLAI